MHQYPRLHGCAIASSKDSATTNLAGESVSFYPCLLELPMLRVYMHPSTYRVLSIILPRLI